MGSKNLGWICLHRQIQDCFLWDDGSAFDVRSAWIDLLLLANHEDKKIMYKGKIITIRRGQRMTSIRKLADRWKWSRGKVTNYLKMLESDGMITVDSDNVRTVVTIENYGVYNDLRATDRATDRATEQATEQTTEEPQTEPQTKPHPSHRPSTNNNENNYITIINNDNHDETMINNDEQCIDDSKESSSSEMTYPNITTRWNELEHLGVTPIRGIKKGSKREESVRRLVRSYGEDDILIAINNIRSSPFLLGKKKDFVIFFDWFIKPANFQKVLEGNYKERGTLTETEAIAEDVEARMKRLGLWKGEG